MSKLIGYILAAAILVAWVLLGKTRRPKQRRPSQQPRRGNGAKTKPWFSTDLEEINLDDRPPG
jgi:hypothetical protein